MKIREEKQQKAAKRKGKLSADTFKLEDEVWIQNAANKKDGTKLVVSRK